MVDEPSTDPFDQLHAGLADKIGPLFQPPADLPGDESGRQIGPYKLLQRIGSGGFGEVYMAEQEEPVRRRVAVKFIRLGMDTKQVIARFEAERQALALMDHPNIARVLDAAATESGRPYFVMELVRGEPITAYCDRENLSIAERLELFAQVCRALQHAHQKAVIHRDIKPSNVLVSTVDGRPLAKVIDFGIAKATDHRLTDKTLFTAFHQMIGTPAYMSPEQAAGSPDIDTRTDIYSLGVLLYEILTGTPPFAAEELRSVAWAEIQRILREVDPPRPSVRLSGLRSLRPGRTRGSSGSAPAHAPGSNSSVEEVAQHRRTDPPTLLRTIRGELDWIVMKCLDKDRSRRYETAGALALDLDRHRSSQPVLAAPPGTAYRLRKFMRRHRSGVVASSLVLLSLLAGIAGTTTFAMREVRERRSTDQRRRETDEVARFQSSQLGGIDTAQMGVRLRRDLVEAREAALEARGSDLPDIEEGGRELEAALAGVNFTDLALKILEENIFERALAAIEKDFADQPLVKARLLQTVADTLHRLGLRHRAGPPQEEALRIRRAVLGDDHPDTLTSLGTQGVLLWDLGRAGEAEVALRKSLEGRRSVLGRDHADTLTAMNDLGSFLEAQGRSSEAEPLLREALAGRRLLLGDDHVETLTSLNSMGSLHQSQGLLAEAVPYFREALERRRRVLGDEHPSTLTTGHDLGVLLVGLGKLAEAEPYHREALAGRRRVLGDEHPDTLMSLNSVGELLVAQGRLVEAEPCFREALAAARRNHGDAHPDTLLLVNNLAFVLHAQGKVAEAERCFRHALEASRGVLGDDHPERLGLVSNLGALLKSRGMLTEAEPYYREALERRRRVLGDDHPDTLISISNLGALLLAQGKPKEAEPYYEEALDRRERVLGNDHPDRLVSLNNMGYLRDTQGDWDEAEEYYRSALEGRRRVLGAEHPDTLLSLHNTGALVREMKRYSEAEALLLEAAAGIAKLPPAHDLRRLVLRNLVHIYTAWHAAEPDAGHDLQRAEWQARLDAWETTTRELEGGHARAADGGASARQESD